MSPLLPYRLPIPKNARVLEIGSGSRPHPRSTILMDRFLADDSHREGRSLVRDQRPFILADGEALPFADGSFDYCICMHVLEHVEHPERMLSEIQRVARAGYIETPTELFDWLFAVPPYTEIHKWYVENMNNELVLVRKTPENSVHRFGPLLDHLRREDPYLERWMEKHPHLFTTQYLWNDKIRWRVEAESGYLGLTGAAAIESFVSQRWRRSDYFWGSGIWGFKRWFYSTAVHPAWRKLAKRLIRR